MTSPSDLWNEAARRVAGARRRAAILIGAVLVAAASLGAASCRPAPAPPPTEVTAEELRHTVGLFGGIPQEGITLGRPDAPVTLVEFADLQCPFCADYAVQTLPILVERYVRAGKLRIEFRNLAFLGEDSVQAARMAAATALQNRQFHFVHLFFLNQGEEGTGYVTDRFLRQIAGAIPGVNVNLAMRQRTSPAVTAQLEAAQLEAARFGIRGTPSFLLGRTGEAPRVLEVSPVRPEAFMEAIEALLEEPPLDEVPSDAPPPAG